MHICVTIFPLEKIATFCELTHLPGPTVCMRMCVSVCMYLSTYVCMCVFVYVRGFVLMYICVIIFPLERIATGCELLLLLLKHIYPGRLYV